MIEILTNAEKYVKTADHIAYVTYPLMKDGNLLKKIVECLQVSVKILFEDKNILKELDTKDKESVEKMNNIFLKRKQSSMEFLRKNKLVLMNDDLRLHSVNLEELKKYIQFLKRLIFKLKNKEKPISI